ncbi:MAG TPA: hypothetical protein VMX97_09230 [Hyphomicrobiaceae bacterium]|nr:hypothetical protein [Hyphomicrobiaceae bacterium]
MLARKSLLAFEIIADVGRASPADARDREEKIRAAMFHAAMSMTRKNTGAQAIRVRSTRSEQHKQTQSAAEAVGADHPARSLLL